MGSEKGRHHGCDTINSLKTRNETIGKIHGTLFIVLKIKNRNTSLSFIKMSIHEQNILYK